MEIILRQFAVLPVLIILCCATVSFLALSAEAKKTKTSGQPYTGAVKYLECQVCNTMIEEAYDAVDLMRKNTTRRQPVREEEIVEEVVEVICNPYAEKGQWIRMGDVRVSDDLKNIGVVYHETYAKCKRDCATIAEACGNVLDSSHADELSPMLFKNKKTRDQILNIICNPFCKKKWGKKGRQLDAEWNSEVREEIDRKEMEIEAMMDNIQRTRQAGEPGMDFFSREEMQGMQQALREGDVDRLAEFDPAAGDLTPEDVAMLRQMQRQDQDDGEGSSSTPEEGTVDEESYQRMVEEAMAAREASEENSDGGADGSQDERQVKAEEGEEGLLGTIRNWFL